MGLSYNLKEKKKYTILKLKLEKGINPEILKEIDPPKINGKKGVVLTGRAPIWLYCYLVHYYHPTKFVATYDPRLGGAIIVESHSEEFNVGDIIKVNDDE